MENTLAFDQLDLHFTCTVCTICYTVLERCETAVSVINYGSQTQCTLKEMDYYFFRRVSKALSEQPDKEVGRTVL